MQHPTLDLPPAFWAMRYSGAHYPGAVCAQTALRDGRGNCQVFAYEVLRHFGHAVPNLRSSEMWADRIWSTPVSTFESLDLLFWNATDEAYGAHVGLCLDAGHALHLSRMIGAPVVSPLQRFTAEPQWAVFLGAKRFGTTTAGVEQG